MDVNETTLSESSPPSILLVDDDQVFVERLARAFRDRGYDVRIANDHDSALALAHAESPEFAVVDLRMPGLSGLDVVRDMKSVDPATHILVLTGYGSIATAVEAIRLGARDYLPKPADVDDILAALHRAPDDKKVMPPDFQPPSLARGRGTTCRSPPTSTTFSPLCTAPPRRSCPRISSPLLSRERNGSTSIGFYPTAKETCPRLRAVSGSIADRSSANCRNTLRESDRRGATFCRRRFRPSPVVCGTLSHGGWLAGEGRAL
jgi:two-component system response regulator RegA